MEDVFVLKFIGNVSKRVCPIGKIRATYVRSRRGPSFLYWRHKGKQLTMTFFAKKVFFTNVDVQRDTYRLIKIDGTYWVCWT